MRQRTKQRVGWVVSLGLLLAGWGAVAAQAGPGQAAPGPARYFCGKGTVVAVDEDRSGITFRHGPIEGFMEAMTMHFKVEGPEVLKDVKAGDRVRFTLKDTPEKTRVVYVEKLPAAKSAPGRRRRH